jgi:hypothetical protein
VRADNILFVETFKIFNNIKLKLRSLVKTNCDEVLFKNYEEYMKVLEPFAHNMRDLLLDIFFSFTREAH